MPLLNRERTVILSSDPARGAGNVSADGHRFEVRLHPALEVPKGAQNVTVELDTADIWYTSPNIKAGVNNLLYMTAPDTLDVQQSYVLAVPTGLYSIVQLEAELLSQLAALGAKTSPLPVLGLSANASTQLVSILINHNGTSFDFTLPGTLRDILGFPATALGLGIGPYTITGTSPAQFNTYNYFLVHSDLVLNGISINGTDTQVLGRVPIQVPPGEQVVYAPVRPPTIDAHTLAGAHRSRIAVWLTDEHGNALDTFGETYTLSLRVSWQIAALA